MRESVKKHSLQEAEAVTMIWSAVMSATEWNKKEDLVMVGLNLTSLASFCLTVEGEAVIMNWSALMSASDLMNIFYAYLIYIYISFSFRIKVGSGSGFLSA